MKVLAAEPNIGMTGQEAHSILDQGKLLQLGTTDKQRDRNIHTVWCICDLGVEKLYLATGKGSKKAQNLKRKTGSTFVWTMIGFLRNVYVERLRLGY